MLYLESRNGWWCESSYIWWTFNGLLWVPTNVSKIWHHCLRMQHVDIMPQMCIFAIIDSQGYIIYANIWGILMVNVTIYSIHGSYGLLHTHIPGTFFRIFWVDGMRATCSFRLQPCRSFGKLPKTSWESQARRGPKLLSRTIIGLVVWNIFPYIGNNNPNLTD